LTFFISEELKESASVIAGIDSKQVEDIARALTRVFRAKGKVVLFGNGGSAADAQHIAAEFSGRYLMDRSPLNGLALTNLSALTAIGNDYSYDQVFERQVEGCVSPGDAVIGISTSGNSRNVLLGIEKAKKLGAITIGFSGPSGKLREEVDLTLVIPSKRTPRIQEGYLAAGHVICGLVEKGIFGRKAVFIDRDDTIAKDVPYCSRSEDLKLFKGVGQAIKRLNEAGFLVIIITNQSGVARGYFDEATLHRIHAKMRKDLAQEGAKVDGIYYCPHLPDSGCSCRKPGPGLVQEALHDFEIDLLGSYFIGDSEHDVELGRRIGARAFRVDSRHPFPEVVEKLLEGE